MTAATAPVACRQAFARPHSALPHTARSPLPQHGAIRDRPRRLVPHAAPAPLRGWLPGILFLLRDTPYSPTVVPEWSCSEIIDRAVRQHVRLESDSSFDYFNIHKELHSLAEEALRSLPKGIKKTAIAGKKLFISFDDPMYYMQLLTSDNSCLGRKPQGRE